MTRNLPRLRLSKSSPDLHKQSQQPKKANMPPSDLLPPRPLSTLKELKDAVDAVARGTSPVSDLGMNHAGDKERVSRSSKRVSFLDSPEETVLSLPAVPTHNPAATEHSKQMDDPANYTKPFCDFITDNPTAYHAVDSLAEELRDNGFTKLSERDDWKLVRGGKYFVERNGTSMIAFIVGGAYEPGNGFAMLAGHIDSLCLKVKPIPTLSTKAGYVQLGVAPYAGALNNTWWDRDLGIAGRVLVKESSGKVVSKLVSLPWPIARIPTLAPHFGAPAYGPFNKETNMVPIIGLDNSDSSDADHSEADDFAASSTIGGASSFATTQPPRLVKAIAGELRITDHSQILNWDLELFDTQPACTGGLDHELLFGPRIDDKACSWAAIEALLNASESFGATATSGTIQLVGLFDDEEIGSLLRQGARSNFLPSTVSRIVDALADGPATPTLLSRTHANSFLVSADVTHAANPNFLSAYLPRHAPRLNVGISVEADANGHVTSDAVSTALLAEIARRRGHTLQVFHIRNDTRSGGTVGPMLSAALGCRAIDCGVPQLSMHSIRATTGALDPGLAVGLFQAFLEEYEAVDREFRQDG